MIDPKLVYALCEDLQNRHAGESEFDRGMRTAAKRIAKEVCGEAAPAATGGEADGEVVSAHLEYATVKWLKPKGDPENAWSWPVGSEKVYLAAAPAAAVEPDMRAVCEALGFDPTNHHNAAQCPYCAASDDAKAEYLRGLEDAETVCFTLVKNRRPVYARDCVEAIRAAIAASTKGADHG